MSSELGNTHTNGYSYDDNRLESDLVTRSIFEIIGPVMIGPSSSHTAGAVRIGLFARGALGERPVKSSIVFYGSFAKTYMGHGTDRAIVGGLMGMHTDDSRIRDALQLAGNEGLQVTFTTGDIYGVHPNTVDISLVGSSGREVFIRGNSVGGGKIAITMINQFAVQISGDRPVLLVEQRDLPGVIGKITSLLGEHRSNIASMQMGIRDSGDTNFMVIETDQALTNQVLAKITSLAQVISAMKIDLF